MPLPLMKIGPLINQLTKLIAVVGPIVQGITKTIREGRNIKETVELQANAIKELEEQMRVVTAVLTNIQKSLQIWVFVTVGTGIVAVISLVLAVRK
jgi:hypothetical protein